ncbi:hypothetical protein WMY93_005541 [Mugilogobius chulae]|uniref:Uncharacterized protein n=1 Tax=Mugilogobius chulae TaxID=88201 RepID=A0AAW0PLQ1_9GOBI
MSPSFHSIFSATSLNKEISIKPAHWPKLTRDTCGVNCLSLGTLYDCVNAAEGQDCGDSADRSCVWVFPTHVHQTALSSSRVPYSCRFYKCEQRERSSCPSLEKIDRVISKGGRLCRERLLRFMRVHSAGPS